jgi:hypothetical protein
MAGSLGLNAGYKAQLEKKPNLEPRRARRTLRKNKNEEKKNGIEARSLFANLCGQSLL